MEGVLARIETLSAGEDIPSVVYGPGDVRIAQCKDESVARDEIIAAAKGAAACVLEWCDVA